jgi:ClpP class serine protease
MIKMFFAMQEQMVQKYSETKDNIIDARNGMSEKSIIEAKETVMKECRVYDIDSELEMNNGKLYSTNNGIATINIAGMLVQKADFCSAFFGETLTTYKYIREATLQADQDPQVNKILYLSDSGGGVVSGCEETFQVIKNANKPTITGAKNMSASACYWLSSATDEIIGLSKTGFYGSIGVAVEIIDRTKAEEDAGIKRIVMTNDSSKDKRPDLLTDEGQEVLTKELNDIYNVFSDSILEKRSGKLSKENIASLKGQVFIASEALEKGLVDKLMTEAELMSYLSVEQINNPSTFGGGNINMEAKMNLADFLKENPEAQKEHDKLVAEQSLVDVTADRERGNKLLAIGGMTISKEIKTAFAEGKTAEQYAYDEVLRNNEAVAKIPDTILGTLEVTSQIPESVEVVNKNKTADEKAIAQAKADVANYTKKGAK